MSDDPILAAIQAARYAESVMARTAAEDMVLPPDAPHQDWQPKYKNDFKPTVRQWHPPFGETHVKYHIYQMGGGRNPIVWGANHHGTYEGMETVESPSGAGGSITWPKYTNGYEPDQLGRFRTPEQAQAAAEEHYRQTYQPPKHDYDIDSIMNDQPTPSTHKGLGDDEDYSHIFGMLRCTSSDWQHGQNYGGSWHEHHYDDNGDYVGPSWPADMSHHLHADLAQAPYNAGYHAAWHPAFVDLDDPMGEARSAWSNAGGPTREIEDFSTFEDGWEDAVNGIPHMWLSPDAHRAYLEGQGDDLRKFNPKRHRDHAEAVRNLRDRPDAGFDPDEHQDPFDPRLLGASRTASVWDWKPESIPLIEQLKDNGLWGGEGDQRSWVARSEAGDHYTIRPAGSVVNTLPVDHPIKYTGDPEHWEVEHHTPEYGHDPQGYFGDFYGPTALNRHAEPVDGVHPHGFSSVQEAMDWVQARHPEESFNPDDKQDPFDPRLIGASRVPEPGEDPVFDNRFDEFQKWMNNEYQLSPERMDAIARDSQPGGKYEQHGHINEYIQEFLNDPRIKGASLRRVGFDWKQGDNDRLSEIARMRSQMQPREAARRIAGGDDIIISPDEPHEEWRPYHRGQLDFAKWHPAYGESHIKYHVYPIGGGSNQRYWRVNDHGLYQGMDSVERPGGGATMTFPVYSNDGDPGRNEPQRISHPVTGDYNFRTMDDAKAAAEHYHAETYGTPPKHDYDIDAILDQHGAPPANHRRDLGDDEDYGHIFGFLRRAGWDFADLIRLAGDGMSWEDTMAHIDKVLAEGEPGPPMDEETRNHYDRMDRECHNCGERYGEHHWDGSCPKYGRDDTGAIDYDDLQGFGSTKFTH